MTSQCLEHDILCIIDEAFEKLFLGETRRTLKDLLFQKMNNLNKYFSWKNFKSYNWQNIRKLMM